MAPTDLLHEALNRHAQQSSPTKQNGNNTALPSFSNLSLEEQQQQTESEDNDIIDVKTPFPSLPSTPTSNLSRNTTPSQSRTSSPTRRNNSKGGGAGKPRRDKTKEREKELANSNTMDPLTKFPGEINGRIFGYFELDDLLICGLVSKKWKKSMTINYTWYLLLQSITFTTPSAPGSTSYSASTSTLPTWRRGDSKIDWAARFASIYRRDDLDQGNSDEDEEGLTMKEEREEKWKVENEELEKEGNDKVAMRKFYKSLGNAKVKGKSGKGGTRTWEGDGVGEEATLSRI